MSTTLLTIAKSIQKTITMSVKRGLWAKTSKSEQPTKEAIDLSIPWAMCGITSYAEKDLVLDYIYPRLRKNGILARLRTK